MKFEKEKSLRIDKPTFFMLINNIFLKKFNTFFKNP